MAKKKPLLDDKSGEARKKTIDELKNKGIEINGDEQVSGGFLETPRWSEDPPPGEQDKDGNSQ